MNEVRIQLTENNFAKKPKATKIKKIKPTYDALLHFASSSFKYNKKKTRLFIRKGGGKTPVGTELTSDSNIADILINDIMIAVSKGNDYIGDVHILNNKELQKLANPPFNYLLPDTNVNQMTNNNVTINISHPKEALSSEICDQSFDLFPTLNGCILPLLKKITDKYDKLDMYYSEAGYYSFDYSDKIDYPPVKDWESAVLRELRGLIVSSVTGKILARRFHKFFNVDEIEETNLHNINLNDATYYDKIDGSLVSPIRLDSNQIVWATRRVIININNELTQTNDMSIFVNKCVSENLTPLFEYCQSTRNVGIINHNEDKLILLAIRDNITGKYIEIENFVSNLNIDIPVVQKINSSMDNIQNEWINREGIVMVLPNGQRYKWKSKWYKCMSQANYYGGSDNFIMEYNNRYGTIQNCPKEYIWKYALSTSNKTKQVNNVELMLFIKRVNSSINYLSQRLLEWYFKTQNEISSTSNLDSVINYTKWNKEVYDNKNSINAIKNQLYNLIRTGNVDIVEDILDTIWDEEETKLYEDVIQTDLKVDEPVDINVTGELICHISNNYLIQKLYNLAESGKNKEKLLIPKGYKPSEGKIKNYWERFANSKYNIWDLRIDLQPSTLNHYNVHYGNTEYALLLVQYGLEDTKKVPKGSLGGILIPVNEEYDISEGNHHIFSNIIRQSLKSGYIYRLRRQFKEPDVGYTIYCDLDGVLADFSKGVYDLTHYTPDEQSANKMWQRINAKESFFEHLEWMPNGEQFWKDIIEISEQVPTILTGLPCNGQSKAIKGKKKWCCEHLGDDVPVITCMTSNKYEYSGKNKILIDDRLKTKDSWIKNGGKFIHHQNNANTLYQLRELFNKNNKKLTVNFKLDKDYSELSKYYISNPIHCHTTLIDNNELDFIIHDFDPDFVSDIKFESNIIGIDFEWNPYRSYRCVHLAQISSNNCIWLFDMLIESQREFVFKVLRDPKILKIGFGLNDDVQRLNCDINNVVDLQQHIVQNYDHIYNNNYPSLEKVTNAILNTTIEKFQNHHITMSQWDNRPLNNKQLIYAAKDASIVLDIYKKLLNNYQIEYNETSIKRDIIPCNLFANNAQLDYYHSYDLVRPIKVEYIGCFLTSESKSHLKELFRGEFSRKSMDHFTIKYNPNHRECKQYNIGQYIDIEITGYYIDLDIGIESIRVNSSLGEGHITISTNDNIMSSQVALISLDKYNMIDKINDKNILTGIIGLEVSYIKDELAGLPPKIKERIIDFEKFDLYQKTLKFKPEELTSTHRAIIHNYAKSNCMKSISNGKGINRKLTLILNRKGGVAHKNFKHYQNMNQVARDNINAEDGRFRLMDISLVKRANLIFDNYGYIGELTHNNIKWNDTMYLSDKIIILRGLSGSGKSMLANIINNTYENSVIFSADQYFIDKEGNYKFVKEDLQKAHQHCYDKINEHLHYIENNLKENVKPHTLIIDNTNSTIKEYRKYKDLAYQHKRFRTIILEIECMNKTEAIAMGKRNKHHTNMKAVLNMYNRWEFDNDAQYIKPYWRDNDNYKSINIKCIKWLTDNQLITSVKSSKKTHMWMSINNMGVKFVNIPPDRMIEFYKIYLESGITGDSNDEHKYLAELVDDKFRLYFDIDYINDIPFENFELLVQIVKKVTGAQDIYITGNESETMNKIKTGMHVHCYDKIVTMQECLELIPKLVNELNESILGKEINITWDNFIDTQAYNCLRMLGSRKVTKDIDKGNVYRVLYKTLYVEDIDLLEKVSCRI